MNSKNIPRLTGGILFCLILQSLKPKSRVRARDKIKGKKSELKESDILHKFLSIIIGESTMPYGGSFQKNTSEYKSCKLNSNQYLDFENPTVINSFNNSVIYKNTDTIKSMSDFVDTVINKQKLEFFVKMIIETIFNDNSISDFETFETITNTFINKNEINKVEIIEIETFLLSVIKFIITKRPNNKDGYETFISWHRQKNINAQWEFVNKSLGISIKQQIKIDRVCLNNDENIYPSEDIEILEPEIVIPSKEDSNNKNYNPVINKNRIINMTGANATYIENIENIENLNDYRKENK